MKRVLAITTAVLLLGSTAAMARGYHPEHYGYNRGYSDHRDNDAGAAIAGGILGFALGALATSQSHDYYAPAYAAPVPAYGYQGYNYGVYGAPAYGYGSYAAPRRPYGYGGTSVNLGFGF